MYHIQDQSWRHTVNLELWSLDPTHRVYITLYEQKFRAIRSILSLLARVKVALNKKKVRKKRSSLLREISEARRWNLDGYTEKSDEKDENTINNSADNEIINTQGSPLRSNQFPKSIRFIYELFFAYSFPICNCTVIWTRPSQQQEQTVCFNRALSLILFCFPNTDHVLIP